jgi:tetratricopeptide (TPR) repeat protein
MALFSVLQRPRLKKFQMSCTSPSFYYANVQKILSRVTSATLKGFAGQQTDDDRVNFVLEQNEDSLFDCQPIYEAKSATESKASREQGNVHYQKQEFNAALLSYSKSVMCAPHVDGNENEVVGVSEELPLALGNRSATLYQLHRFEESITDIDLAFNYRFPEHIHYKLYDRKGRCLMEIKQIDKAIECFGKVKEVLAKAKLNEKQKEKIVVNSDKQIERCKALKIELATAATAAVSLNPQNPQPPQNRQNRQHKCNGESTTNGIESKLVIPEIQTASKRFPVADESFDVKYTASKGRYAFAATNVTVGTDLLLEKPFSQVLDPALYNSRCFHCFKLLDIEPIPCQQCTTVRYCSDSCRAESWEGYHQWECKFLGLLNSSGTGYIAQLALKTVVTAGIELILKCRRNPNSDCSEAQKALFTDSKGVYHGGFIGLYNLLAHTKDRAINDLLQYTILAVFLTRILETSGFISSKAKKEDPDIVKIVGGVLLRFLQIIACNGVEVVELVRGINLQKCYPEAIGLCLYPTVSLINHSCNPAMELLFFNNQVVARAIRNIAAGEELSIDYGYIYYVTPKSQRQMYLSSQYFFECQCEACKNDWPLKAELKSDIPVLKCIECFCPLSLFGNKDPMKVDCYNCRLIQNPLEYFDALRKSSMAFEKAFEEARLFEIEKNVPILEEHLILMDTHLTQPWKEYTTCVSTLKQCYRLEANVRPAVTEHKVGF